ncbi:hypothetical protein K402DRAFT_22243 [Aulographum hederae CBS 113979]|uniref:Uncharacterized protein n=1 Tax=Aulographum hederae CBS 113979 TaxID=1176131 RepID=A0A6G1H7F8_9PEZI|nr:hypothetical protein K402DRAFT_22243 [Aulographum hederae CBS 113979]
MRNARGTWVASVSLSRHLFCARHVAGRFAGDGRLLDTASLKSCRWTGEPHSVEAATRQLRGQKLEKRLLGHVPTRASKRQTRQSDTASNIPGGDPELSRFRDSNSVNLQSGRLIHGSSRY